MFIHEYFGSDERFLTREPSLKLNNAIFPYHPLEYSRSKPYYSSSKRELPLTMNALTRVASTYWNSSIGKKLVVALTGLFLLLFLLGHLVGNLVVYMGPDPFNQYAYFLHHMGHGAGIWAFRIVMLVMLAAHIVATIQLTKQNKAARQSYAYQTTIQASGSSRYMILTGLTVAAFFIYHILHFTARVGNSYDTSERYITTLHGIEGEVHNAWQMVIDGFSPQAWYVSLFYIIAMTFLASHLMHGFQSVFQTLGLRSKKSAATLKQLSIGYTALIWFGFVSIPVAVFLGFGR